MQGSNFFQGVRFSVHTISLGNDEYRNVLESLNMDDVAPCRRNDISGDAELSDLMKLSEAQNWPESTFVKSCHSSSMLNKYKNSYSSKLNQSDLVLS